MSELSPDALAVLNSAGVGETKKPSLMPIIAATLGLTVVALLGGGGLGWLLGANQPPAEAPAAPVDPALAEAGEGPAPAAVPMPGGNLLIPLEPVLTNIASPPSSQIRIEASILVDAEGVESPELLAAQVQADTLVFVRTIDLAQIEGARGLLHLREDLKERARLRSPAVSDYIIRQLVAQ